MKNCNKCETVKPKTEFSVKKRSKQDGLQPFCKSCMKAYLAERYQANKDDYVERVRTRKAEIKKQFVELKANLKCARCPEDHPAALDFHHRDSTTKDLNVSAAVHEGWKLDRIKEEIAKCEVLCSNCHRKLHWSERNGAA